MDRILIITLTSLSVFLFKFTNINIDSAMNSIKKRAKILNIFFSIAGHYAHPANPILVYMTPFANLEHV